MDEDTLMTREQFLQYASELTGCEALECVYERIAEHNNEVAAFGDSWPGALFHIHNTINRINAIERQAARLEGREPRNFRFNVNSPR